MGCISTSSKGVKEVQSLKHLVRLEYELNNCYDHFKNLSFTIQRSQRFIFKSVGKELGTSEYYDHFIKIDCESAKSKLQEQFETFFQAVEEGLSLLPLILKQMIKLEMNLKDKKDDILQLKEAISTHIDFCKNVTLPSQISSQSTQSTQSSEC